MIEDYELYQKLTTQQGAPPRDFIVRLSRDATRQLMDGVAVHKSVYFLLTAEGEVKQRLDRWDKALFLAQQYGLFLYNPRSCKALIADKQGFQPVRLFFHREVFDSHPVRGRQLTQYPNQCWDDLDRKMAAGMRELKRRGEL